MSELSTVNPTGLSTVNPTGRQGSRAGTVGMPSERGQSTVEYAILLLGAAAIAMLVVAWVSDSDVIGRLFQTVFDRIISRT